MEHMRQHAAVRQWLLQPYLPRFDLCEYKVFLSGERSMVAYAIIRGEETANVYCPGGHMYSEIMGPDALSTRADRQDLATPWPAAVFHDKLVGFARRCRSAFCSGAADMACLSSVLCRVDVVCLFGPKAQDQDSVQYDVDDPLLLLNELDDLGSASLMLDMNDPKRDSTVGLLPTGAVVPAAGRDPCQASWVQKLREMLVRMLFGDRVHALADMRGREV
jgi:hypothetical protein